MTSFTSDQEWYYLNDEAENLGPFNVTELAGFHESGAVKDTTFVWHEDIKDEAWASANEVEGLLAFFKKTAKKTDTAKGETKTETKPQIKPGSHGRRKSVVAMQMEDDKNEAKQKSIERRASMFGKKNVKAPPAVGEDDLTKL